MKMFKNIPEGMELKKMVFRFLREMCIRDRYRKRCAVESDMLKGIFISKMVLWVKLLVCPWCRGLRGVR